MKKTTVYMALVCTAALIFLATAASADMWRCYGNYWCYYGNLYCATKNGEMSCNIGGVWKTVPGTSKCYDSWTCHMKDNLQYSTKNGEIWVRNLNQTRPSWVKTTGASKCFKDWTCFYEYTTFSIDGKGNMWARVNNRWVKR